MSLSFVDIVARLDAASAAGTVPNRKTGVPGPVAASRRAPILSNTRKAIEHALRSVHGDRAIPDQVLETSDLTPYLDTLPDHGRLAALEVDQLENAADAAQAPLQRMEHALHGLVAFVIMPVFALANAGVPLGAGAAAAVRSPIAWGVLLGLALGKPLGITFASWLAVHAGAADLPSGVAWRHVHGAGWLGGIGFTMSLFVAGLAFADPAVLDIAKLGVFGASLVAGVVGYTLLRRGAARPPAGDVSP